MITLIAVTALLIVTTALAAVRPPFVTRMEWAIALCETGGNWKHHTRDYQGAYGFYKGSWDAFRPSGYPSEAYNATPWQQTVVMRRIRARYGWTGWGCYTHGGYRSHL